MTQGAGLIFKPIPGRAFPGEKSLRLSGITEFPRGRVQVLSDTHWAVPVSQHHLLHDDDDLQRYLRKINDELACAANNSSFEVLIFNGDAFEITGSCASYGDGHFPYLADGSLHKPELTRQVIAEILNSNNAVIEQLQRFLSASANHRIVFVKGNHDAFLGLDFEAQSLIKKKLTGTNDSDQIAFCSEIEIPELRFYARHGQDLDSINNTAQKALNKGDLLNFMAYRLSKIVVDEIGKLRSSFGSQAKTLIDEFQQQVVRISDFRPLPSFWLYMEMLVAKYASKARTIQGLPEAIVAVGNNFYNSFYQIATNKEVMREFESLYCSPWISKVFSGIPPALKERSLRSRFAQKLITHSAAKFHDWFSSNKPQLEMALKLVATNPDIDVVSFGHTHRPSDERGSLRDFTGKVREYRVVNTGTWAPSIFASPVEGSLRFLREQKNSGVLSIDYSAEANPEAVYRTSFYSAVKTKL